MKPLISILMLILPCLGLADPLYKCTVNGIPKYQAVPCTDSYEATPLHLNEPSKEIKEKMLQQELAHDYQKQENTRQKTEDAETEHKKQVEDQIEQERLNYYRNLELDRQAATERIQKMEQEKFEWRCEHGHLRQDHFSDCAKYLDNKRWHIKREDGIVQ
jgi:hypothetical protein